MNLNTGIPLSYIIIITNHFTLHVCYEHGSYQDKLCTHSKVDMGTNIDGMYGKTARNHNVDF